MQHSSRWKATKEKTKSQHDSIKEAIRVGLPDAGSGKLRAIQNKVSMVIRKAKINFIQIRISPTPINQADNVVNFNFTVWEHRVYVQLQTA